MAALKESTRNWLLQLAIDKVKDGREPKDAMTDEEKACYERTVAQLQEFMDMVGPEQFAKTTFDVGYDY